MATVNAACERKEATTDVLHEEGPRAQERVAQDDREQADGGGSPPPARGARPAEGEGGEASEGEGQGGSRPQVGGTRLKTEEAKRPRVRTRGLFEIPGPIRAISTSLQEGRALEGFGALVRAYYQDRAGSVADNPIGDTPFDDPPYPPMAPATHYDQSHSEFLGQNHNLQVHRPHPEVRPGYGSPSHLHPPGQLSEQLPGLLLDLLVELA